MMSDKSVEDESARMDALMDEMALKVANKGPTDGTADKKSREVSNSVWKQN